MTPQAYRAVSTLPSALADILVGIDCPHPLRAVIDGPICAQPGELAEALVPSLQALGRPTAVVHTEWFWRDASLRLEFGHEDPESFAGSWLDVDALCREVLAPLAVDGAAQYLPTLRDPSTNRVTRARPVAIARRGIVLVAGSLLLGRNLPFDYTIHLSVTAAARRRRTEPAWQWTLPAFDDYDATVDPVSIADVVVRYDDPAHPALSE